jgi:hypothetical protein
MLMRKLALGALQAACVVGAVAGATEAAADDLVITIERVRALDRIDLSGQPDFFAQVTIDGKVTKTEVAPKSANIRPNWVIRAPITKDVTDVKIEIFDKDLVSKDDAVDINRLPKKRDLDFSVRRNPCRVIGFAQIYDCSGRGARITRAGDERRKAEITFKVDIRR